MKNQNDIIISAVAIVLALIFFSVFYFTQAQPVKPAPPEQVITTPATFQPGAVVMADKLPGGSAQQGGAPAGGRQVGMAPGPGARPGGPPPPGGGAPTSGSSQFTVGVAGASSGR